ncbi:MAG: hypothetical protein CIT01_08365 [Methanobacterium sp. BRmetb2]|jgi:hypothetical protein|nr:MAG: hypothetical protein CIT01_08365 [Methanobacterium sp. BRmetb2]
MKIGLVVHGPHIVDSGYAAKILELLKEYGIVKARLGGTMGRTAVYDAHLETFIDISTKLLPSQSIDKFTKENFDIIFLINYGKSSLTGHAFGYKVFNRCKTRPQLIQIERPGEGDGSIIPWSFTDMNFIKELSNKLDLRIVYPDSIINEMENKYKFESDFKDNKNIIIRKIAGVSPDENIFVNGIVVGRSKSSEVFLVAENGIITELHGGEIKEHGVEKLGIIDLKNAIIKTGLLRKSKIKPRVVEEKDQNGRYKIAFLNHAAEDIYKLKDADMVVTVGDDTTLVAGDILYRFKVPIIGITDGDLDKVVENGFKTDGSMIIELESGWDDIVGQKLFIELFNQRERIETENIENFKKQILHIINNTVSTYNIKDHKFSK